jgi:hypothetical protein
VTTVKDTDDNLSNVVLVQFSKDKRPRIIALTNKEAETLAVITAVVALCYHIDMDENRRQAMINRIRKGE